MPTAVAIRAIHQTRAYIIYTLWATLSRNETNKTTTNLDIFHEWLDRFFFFLMFAKHFVFERFKWFFRDFLKILFYNNYKWRYWLFEIHIDWIMIEDSVKTVSAVIQNT